MNLEEVNATIPEEPDSEPIEKPKGKYAPKPKRKASEAQLANLARGRANRQLKAKQVADEKGVAKEKRMAVKLEKEIAKEDAMPPAPKAQMQLPPQQYQQAQQYAQHQPIYMVYDPRMMQGYQAPPPTPVAEKVVEKVAEPVAKPRLKRI
jgi:hypothetical protein